MKFHTKIRDYFGRNSFRKTILTVSAATLLLSASGAAMAVPMYTITDLGDLPGGSDESIATGINDRGQVVGVSGAATGPRAFLWQSGGMTDLGDLPGGEDYSYAVGINDSGQVVGSSGAAAGERAILWQSGGMTDLGDLPGGQDYSRASGINDSGQVVGSSGAATGGPRAFLWETGAMTDLGDLPGGADVSYAKGINNSGQVVGYSEAATGTRAFLWETGTGMTDLGSLWEAGLGDSVGGSGGGDLVPDFSYATGINNVGQVVGHSDTTNGVRAFLWQDGAMTDLGDLPGGYDASIAWGINDSGQVVGYSEAATGTRAFLWEDSFGMLDLNDLLVDPTGWDLVAAYAINASGQIVGQGYHNWAYRGFLLTPVDAGPPQNAAAPNTLELARLALHVYPDSRRSDIGDFESLGVIPGAEADINLPFAEAFIRRGENEGQDQIVISVRGTESDLDKLRDVGFSGLPLEHFDEALLAVAEFAGDIRRQNPLADFTFTGHSLGAGIATILATEAGVDAVTFNGPGTRNVASDEYRETLGQIMGNLPSSAQDVVNYRHYGDFVSLIGSPEGGVNTVYDDALTPLLTDNGILCFPCHNMGNLLDLLASGARITPGIEAPVSNAIIFFPVAVGLEGARKLFNVGADQDIFQLFDPPLIGDVIEIDLGLSDVMINGILVGGLLGDEFPLLALSDDEWLQIGTLFPYVPLDVASYPKYQILNASRLVDDFGNFIVGLRFDREGTFRGSLGAPESTQSVPEPGTLFLLGTGLLALLRARRKWAA